jgi:hypothetical protein
VRFNGNTPVRNTLITRASARLRAVGERHGAVYVHDYRRLAADDELTVRPGLADDGLHLTPHGSPRVTPGCARTVRSRINLDTLHGDRWIR